MSDEIVYRPHVDLRYQFRQVALISAAFFVFVELAFLDDAGGRMAFAIVYVVFLLTGIWLMRRHARNWPQEIRIGAQGITYTDLCRRHGVDIVPWAQIDKMDVCWSVVEGRAWAPFLRIRLRPGPFRDRLVRPLLQRLSFGWDVNIPLQVAAEPEAVLETAKDWWARFR